jgi:hypothetical protein
MLRHHYRRSQLMKNSLSAVMCFSDGLHIFRNAVLRNFNVIWFILLACNTLTGRMHVRSQKRVAFFNVEVAGLLCISLLGYCAYRRWVIMHTIAVIVPTVGAIPDPVFILVNIVTIIVHNDI